MTLITSQSLALALAHAYHSGLCTMAPRIMHGAPSHRAAPFLHCAAILAGQATPAMLPRLHLVPVLRHNGIAGHAI